MTRFGIPASIACVVFASSCSAEKEVSVEGVAIAAVPPPALTVNPTKRGIQRPLSANTKGFVMVDRVDVADEADERAHAYAIVKPTFFGKQEFEPSSGKSKYVEDGRATKSSESFRVKVVPHQDHVLIKAYDTLAKAQKVRVLADGKELGIWSAPNAGSNRYAEASFPIPGSAIGGRSQLEIKLEYVSGEPDTNAFVYWMFGKPTVRLDGPTSVNVSDAVLTDRLDVGEEADEASHRYTIENAKYAGLREFQSPKTGELFLESMRAHKAFESFRVKVMPGKDHLLVKAYDTTSKKQVVRVSVEGKTVGDWKLPDGSAKYAEDSFRIPATFIGSKTEVDIRVEFVAASIDSNSVYYWVYAASKS